MQPLPKQKHFNMAKMRRNLHAAFVFLFVFTAFGQTVPATGKADYSKEPMVVEEDSTKGAFENDGTSTRVSTVRIRIQSEAGLQQFGVLTFSYQNSVEALDIDYVRVKKPDGSAVITPAENIQDMAADITRAAPFYSDLREKHVAVKGLGVGDVLEYQAHWLCTKPLAAGQFWFAANLPDDAIYLQHEIEISVPRERSVKWKSPKLQPVIREENGRRIFRWTTSQLEPRTFEWQKKDKAEKAYDAQRGLVPAADLQLSSFQSWDEIGRWYAGLQEDRVKPAPEIRAKAAELTRNATTENAKLQAIYDYVSTQFRYVGIAFGIGRYQPHYAAEVLSNQYGDCKDKHTLLASLLAAAGIKAYPALVNVGSAIDPDVPSPAQFNHVITAVPRGKDLIWLDSTTEVAPFAYLLSMINNKPALVLAEGKPAEFIPTTSAAASKPVNVFEMKAKLDNKGTLDGKVNCTMQGDDGEVIVRSAFRRVSLTQWKDLVQGISYATGFAGDVSDVTAGQPDKTNEPFHYSYTYTRKDYPNWADREISAPLPPVMLPEAEEDEAKPSHPVWLGSGAELHFTAEVQLPKGYVPQLPKDVNLKEDFAEYHATYTLKEGVLIAERQYVPKLQEVPIGETDAYKKFRKAVAGDHELYIALQSNTHAPTPRGYQSEIWELPYSENPEAARAYDEAREDYKKEDYMAQLAAIKRTVEIDPKFTRAWLWLGEVYASKRQYDDALQAFRHALEVDREKPVCYKALGYTLLALGKSDEAIPVWQGLIKIAPDDETGPSGLAVSFQNLKRYGEAAAALETAVKINPKDPALQMRLGTVYINDGQDEKGLAAYKAAIELDSRPVIFNDIGYSLSEANKQLPMALEYAQKAVREEEEASANVKLSSLDMDDLAHASKLAAYWDTLGWVHFKMGNLEDAHKYINAAWMLSQSPVEGEHLGEIYEKQQKKVAAIQAYRLALAASTPFPGSAKFTDNIQQKLKFLGAKESKTTFGAYPGGDELSRMRTAKLSRLIPDSGSAELFLLIGPGSKVEDVLFISGSDKLKTQVKSLTSMHINQPLPDDGPTRLVRRAMLGCFQVTGCSLVLMPPDLVRSVN